MAGLPILSEPFWYILVLLLKAIVWAVELVTDFLLGYTYAAGSRRVIRQKYSSVSLGHSGHAVAEAFTIQVCPNVGPQLYWICRLHTKGIAPSH